MYQKRYIIFGFLIDNKFCIKRDTKNSPCFARKQKFRINKDTNVLLVKNVVLISKKIFMISFFIDL